MLEYCQGGEQEKDEDRRFMNGMEGTRGTGCRMLQFRVWPIALQLELT